jgi:hypothetical protein
MVQNINRSKSLWKAKRFPQSNKYKNLRSHSNISKKKNMTLFNPKKYYLNLINKNKKIQNKKLKSLAHTKIAGHLFGLFQTNHSDYPFSGI